MSLCVSLSLIAFLKTEFIVLSDSEFLIYREGLQRFGFFSKFFCPSKKTLVALSVQEDLSLISNL